MDLNAEQQAGRDWFQQLQDNRGFAKPGDSSWSTNYAPEDFGSLANYKRLWEGYGSKLDSSGDAVLNTSKLSDLIGKYGSALGSGTRNIGNVYGMYGSSAGQGAQQQAQQREAPQASPYSPPQPATQPMQQQPAPTSWTGAMEQSNAGLKAAANPTTPLSGMLQNNYYQQPGQGMLSDLYKDKQNGTQLKPWWQA